MMLRMRTTVTLDPDVEAQLRAAMRERGVSFKVAINDAAPNPIKNSEKPAGPIPALV